MATKTKASKPVLTDDQLVKQIVQLRKDGISNAAIAAELGIGLATVYKLVPVKRNGNAVAVKPAKTSAKPAATKSSPGFRRKVILAKPPKTVVDKGIGVVDIAVVKAVELHRWLSDVQPFAGHDATLPMLTATRVEWDGKRFLAATTDRFTMGISKLDVPDNGLAEGSGLDEADFMLAAGDVASILRIAKTAKRDTDWRQVTISRVGTLPAGVTVPTFTYRFAFFSGETLEIKPFDVEFPKFKQLLPTGEPVARALSAFTAEYLVKFAKVANDHSGRIKLYSFDASETGGEKPSVALIGDNFVGLIMPVRCPDDAGWVKPGWVS